jgi:UDP-GlcNAc:undecaprenyl-phosphate GlcNAc-1-phosphate transferase
MSWIDGGFVTLTVTMLMLLALRPVAFAIGLVDRPGGRKTHVGLVPIIGGICMWGGISLSLPLIQPAVPGTAAFIAASTLLLLIGFIDDRFELPAKVRLVAQASAGLIMCLGADLIARSLGNILFLGDIPLGLLAIPFTVLVAISVINAFNMLDGIDGLAGSMGLAAIVPAAAMAFIGGASGALAIATLVSCATIAFLVFNFPMKFNRPVRTFMGDAGSTVIGFSVVWVGIKLAHGSEAVISPVTALWLAALPIFDLFISFGRRISKGQNPMSPDRGHFHHILQRAGFRDREVVLIMGLSGLIISVIGCAGSSLGVHEGVMFLGLIAMGVVQAWVYSRAWRIARWLKRRRSGAATVS